jgi:GNAT superfamily N-acetyltransferase
MSRPGEYLRAKNTAAGFAADVARMWTVIVDEQSGLVTGVGGLEHSEITRLYVDPAYQRRGVGIGILRHLEEVARQKGLTTLAVRSSEHARLFYLSQGYAPIDAGNESVGPATFHWIDMVKQLVVST